MKKFFLLASFTSLLCSVLFISTANGQGAVLKGIITDDSGNPIPGVNVILSELSIGAATDLEGNYRITSIPAGTYTLIASAIGYRRFTSQMSLTDGEVRTEDIALNEIVLESSGVTVTASRREQRSSTAPVSLSVLTPRELESRNVYSIDEVLRHVPGIQVKGNQVSIRGSTGYSYNVGSRVQFLLDGLPLLTPDSDGIPFEALPFDQIQRVEVLKGPGSALYGSGALGGVINVITKEFPDIPETNVRTFAGAYEPVKYDSWRNKWEKGGDVRPFFGGSFTHAQKSSETFGFWTNLHFRRDPGYTRLSERTSILGFTKLGWRPKPTIRFDILTSWLWRKKDDFIFWNAVWDALNPGLLPNGNPASSDNVSSQFGLLPTFTHVINPKLYYSVKARLFGIHLRPLDDETGKPRSAKTDGTQGFRYGAEYQLNWTPRSDYFMTAGLSIDSNWARSSFFGDEADGVSSSFLQPEGAAFFQWEQPLFGQLNVVAGARFDVYAISKEETITRFSPKLNAYYIVNDNLTIRAAYGQGFRVPSLAERFANDEAFGITSNPDIRPEESTSIEVGLRSLFRAGANNEIQFDVAMFYNEYANLIESGVNTDLGALWFRNLPDATIQGIEAAVDAALFSGKLQTRAGYSYLDSETQRINPDSGLEETVPLEFRPNHQFNFAVDLQLWKGLSAGADLRYISRPERHNEDFGFIVTSAEVLTEARVLDARLGWQWQQFRVGLILRNALEYYYLERPARLAPPRNVILQLQAKL